MKRRAFIVKAGLFVPAFPAILHAQVMPSARHIAAPTPATVVAGGSCDTEKDTNTGATDSYSGASGTANAYFGCKVTPASPYTSCAVKLFLSKGGSPTYDIYCGIWSHNATDDQPNAVIEESTAINASTLTTSEAEYTFSSIGASVTSGTDVHYWIVLRFDPAPSFSNYIRIYRRNITGLLKFDADAAGVWTLEGDNRRWKFVMYA
jgi:hypothetical protein